MPRPRTGLGQSEVGRPQRNLSKARRRRENARNRECPDKRWLAANASEQRKLRHLPQHAMLPRRRQRRLPTMPSLLSLPVTNRAKQQWKNLQTNSTELRVGKEVGNTCNIRR